MHITIKTTFFLLIAAPIPLNVAMAANWEWGSRFALNANWSDNPALADDARDPVSTFRMVASYRGRFERLSPGNNFRIEPRVTRDYYPDREFAKLESTDIFLPGSYNHTRRRTSWNLGYNLSRQNVLSDATTISEGGANQLNADDLVYRASLSPSMSWQVSERDQLLIGLSANATDFDKDFTNRSDQIGTNISATYTRQVTERQDFGFSAFSFSSEAERLNFVIQNPLLCNSNVAIETCIIETDGDSTSFTLNYGYNISSTGKVFVKGGLQSTETTTGGTVVATGEQVTLDPFEFKSTTYDIGYDKVTEGGDFRIAASRRVQPNTNGQPQDRYDLRFIGDTKLSQKLDFDWNFLIWQQQAIALRAINEELDEEIKRKTVFFSGTLQLNWTLTRKWRLNGRYTYRQRDRDTGINSDEQDKATGNQLFFGVTYIWKQIQR
jgi:hypothetical protein